MNIIPNCTLKIGDFLTFDKTNSSNHEPVQYNGCSFLYGGTKLIQTKKSNEPYNDMEIKAKYPLTEFKETKYLTKKLKNMDFVTYNGETMTVIEYYPNNDCFMLENISQDTVTVKSNEILELKYIEDISKVIDISSFMETFTEENITYSVVINGKEAKYPFYNVDKKYSNNVFSTKQEAIDYANMWLGIFGNLKYENDETQAFMSQDGRSVLITKIITEPFNFDKEYKKVKDIENLFNTLYDAIECSEKMSMTYYYIRYNVIEYGKVGKILKKYPDFCYNKNQYTDNEEYIDYFMETLLYYVEKIRNDFRIKTSKVISKEKSSSIDKFMDTL